MSAVDVIGLSTVAFRWRGTTDSRWQITGAVADVRPGRNRDRHRLLRLDFHSALRPGARVMSAADVFGLAVSIAVLAYLVYALFRGERL